MFTLIMLAYIGGEGGQNREKVDYVICECSLITGTIQETN